MNSSYIHNENALFIGISEGDEAAFSACYSAYGRMLMPFLIRLVGSRDSAEEIIVSDPVGRLQAGALSSLLSVSKFARLEANATRYGAAATYGIDELINDVKKGVWGELSTHAAIDL